MDEGRVIQAQRVEVVDAEGRVRLVAGELGDVPGAYGLAVVDADGAVRARVGFLDQDSFGSYYGVGAYGEGGALRASITVGPTGAFLVFDEDEDMGLLLGVADEIDPGDHAGPLVVVRREDGQPLQLWPDLLERLAADEPPPNADADADMRDSQGSGRDDGGEGSDGEAS